MLLVRRIALYLLLCALPLQGFAQGHCFVSALGQQDSAVQVHDCGHVMDDSQDEANAPFAGCGHCSPLCAGAAITSSVVVPPTKLVALTVFSEPVLSHRSRSEPPQDPPPIVQY
jgi:hypothetical protein